VAPSTGIISKRHAPEPPPPPPPNVLALFPAPPPPPPPQNVHRSHFVPLGILYVELPATVYSVPALDDATVIEPPPLVIVIPVPAVRVALVKDPPLVLPISN